MKTITYGTKEYWDYVVGTWVRDPLLLDAVIEAERSDVRCAIGDRTDAMAHGLSVADTVKYGIELSLAVDEDVDPVQEWHYGDAAVDVCD